MPTATQPRSVTALEVERAPLMDNAVEAFVKQMTELEMLGGTAFAS
jgi:hypothetical protein